MKKETKILTGIGICGSIIGGLCLLRKMNERLTRIQMALYDIADSTETLAMNFDPMFVETINDNVDEMRNHTDDIASCIIEINQALHPEPMKRAVQVDPYPQSSPMGMDNLRK